MKLYYFPIHGRAEAIRMLLMHAKQEFEDVAVSQQEFGKMKTDSSLLEFGLLPMLELPNGQRLSQTKAILRTLGQTHGYWTKDPKEAWIIDSTMDSVNDELSKIATMKFCQDDEEKKALFFDYLTKGLPQWLSIMEKRLAGKKFVVGDRITIADFCLGAFLHSVHANPENPASCTYKHVLKEYPAVTAYIATMGKECEQRLQSRAPAFM
jgi:glutathione S-transferase